MTTMIARDVLVSMANMKGTTVMDITCRYNQFVCGEKMFAYKGAAVSNDGHTQLSIDGVSAILANNGFFVFDAPLVGLMAVPVDADAKSEMQFRKSIRSNMPSIMDAVAGVTGQDDKPELDKYFTKPDIVPDLPPTPERKPKLVIHIEIDNNDLDNAVMEFEGNIVDAVEALYIAGKYNESMIKPIIGAAAMLVVDDPVLQQKFDELKAYFSKTPQHG